MSDLELQQLRIENLERRIEKLERFFPKPDNKPARSRKEQSIAAYEERLMNKDRRRRRAAR